MPAGVPLSLVLSPKAKQDLVDIHRYTVENWGDSQAVRYTTGLKQAVQDVLRARAKGAVRPELGEGLRSVHCEKHVIFYRQRDNTIQIVRVLHGRQDPARHL